MPEEVLMSGARRASDRVTTDDVELVFTLAYEKALENGDKTVVDSVSLTILKLREVTGTAKSCNHCGTMPPGFECKHCGRLA